MHLPPAVGVAWEAPALPAGRRVGAREVAHSRGQPVRLAHGGGFSVEQKIMQRRVFSPSTPANRGSMHRPWHNRPPSVTGLILAASDISGHTVLGDLPRRVVKLLEVDEPSRVQATNEVMFHLATRHKDRLRRDTSLYQWLGRSARAIIANPHAVAPAHKARTYRVIGKVEPPDRYPTIEYLMLILKHVPQRRSSSGTAELWLSTMIAHSQKTIDRYLRQAVLVHPLPATGGTVGGFAPACGKARTRA